MTVMKQRVFLDYRKDWKKFNYMFRKVYNYKSSDIGTYF